MTKKLFFTIGLIILIVSACRKRENDFEVKIPEFNFPKSHAFEAKLSAYNIFEGSPSALVPSAEFELLELNSSLFSDYAHKQRLVKLPLRTKMTSLSDGALNFPNGTILTKTFYYYVDERDTSLGRRIIETRLLIKESNTWNAATYLWNESQTEATLNSDGHYTQVSWTNSQRNTRSTLYHVPTENECMTCHQSSASMNPLGPTLTNLNKTVIRNNAEINQIVHLQALEVLEQFSLTGISQMVDYNDVSASLSDRGRAYLAMNCAHCHNPKAWDIPAEKDFDFRHDIPFELTGIQNGKDKISRNLINQEMPFIGTTLMHDEGVALMIVLSFKSFL